MFKSQRFIGIGIVGLACALLTACAGMRQAPTGFVAPGATWQEVSREGMVFGEGVVAAPNGIVYFSSMTRALPPGPDNPGGTIFRFDPATGQTTKYLEPSGMSNGLHFDRNGDLLIAQDSGGERQGRRPRDNATQARHRSHVRGRGPLPGQALQRSERPHQRRERAGLFH